MTGRPYINCGSEVVRLRKFSFLPDDGIKPWWSVTLILQKHLRKRVLGHTRSIQDLECLVRVVPKLSITQLADVAKYQESGRAYHFERSKRYPRK